MTAELEEVGVRIDRARIDIEQLRPDLPQLRFQLQIDARLFLSGLFLRLGKLETRFAVAELHQPVSPDASRRSRPEQQLVLPGLARYVHEMPAFGRRRISDCAEVAADTQLPEGIER